MSALVKAVITQITLREATSDPSDIRYLRIQYDSEGAGRHFILTDESDFDGNGNKIILSTPDDFKMLYEAAKQMWDQGSIFCEGEDW